MNNLYREEILEHYKDPQNFGKPTKFTHSSKLTNPFCGDNVEMFVNIKKNKKPRHSEYANPELGRRVSESIIEDIGFTGVGCAISIAATSILTEFAMRKSIRELTSLTEKDMLNLLKIEVSETRKKCALLGYTALKDCIK